MKKRRKITMEPQYNGHPILTSKSKNLGCDMKILDSIKRTLDHAISEKSRVMMVRYDVRLPDDCASDSNHIFSIAQADFMKHLRRQGLSPHYVAVREESQDKPHFHVALTLDHSKTKSPYKHLQKMEEIVSRKVSSVTGRDTQSGVVEFCNKDHNGNSQPNAHVISRHDPNSFDEAFERASYLAKVNTKPEKRIRELFVSQLNKRDKNS